MKLAIRPAATEDAAAIAAIIKDQAKAFLIPGEEQQALPFWASVSEQAERTYIASDDIELYVAPMDGTVIGFIGVKGGTHLFHLFISGEYQRQGIGTQLWKHFRDRLSEEDRRRPVTVNAATTAIDFYRKLGFRQDAAAEQKHGINFARMSLRSV